MENLDVILLDYSRAFERFGLNMNIDKMKMKILYMVYIAPIPVTIEGYT